MLSLTKTIKTKLADLAIQTSDKQLEQFERYLLLLEKWNKTYNLTAIRNLDEMLEKHLIDSLSIAPYIDAQRCLDVGTGAGLPGIPLAILYPEKRFTLLDSNNKKTRFLAQVKTELALSNVQVQHSRIEQFKTEQPFDIILSRAFSSLSDMLDKSGHLCAQTGRFFAMKGKLPEQELQEITKPYKVLPIAWQGVEFERHLIIIDQNHEALSD